MIIFFIDYLLIDCANAAVNFIVSWQIIIEVIVKMSVQC